MRDEIEMQRIRIRIRVAGWQARGTSYPLGLDRTYSSRLMEEGGVYGEFTQAFEGTGIFVSSALADVYRRIDQARQHNASTLDLSHLTLKALPEAITDLIALTELNL